MKRSEKLSFLDKLGEFYLPILAIVTFVPTLFLSYIFGKPEVAFVFFWLGLYALCLGLLTLARTKVYAPSLFMSLFARILLETERFDTDENYKRRTRVRTLTRQQAIVHGIVGILFGATFIVIGYAKMTEKMISDGITFENIGFIYNLPLMLLLFTILSWGIPVFYFIYMKGEFWSGKYRHSLLALITSHFGAIVMLLLVLFHFVNVRCYLQDIMSGSITGTGTIIDKQMFVSSIERRQKKDKYIKNLAPSCNYANLIGDNWLKIQDGANTSVYSIYAEIYHKLKTGNIINFNYYPATGTIQSISIVQ